jgi:voltage-gated potassium channel
MQGKECGLFEMAILRKIYIKAIKMDNALLILSSLVLIFFSSYFIYYLEPETFNDPFNGLWWVMTTITTVGYGDISPVTVEGKLFAMFLYIIGIGMIGVLIGKIVDLMSIIKKRREEGRVKYSGENHVIIFGWSKKAELAVQEILGSNSKTDIVLIDQLEKAPMLDDRVIYIRGDAADKETLEKANVTKAQAAIIFADDKIADPSLTDGKSMLIATTIERMARHVHTSVEIMKENHIENFSHINVDEFILSHKTISSLAVRAAFSNGITSIFTQLMSRRQGDDLHEIKKRPHWKTYRDAFNELLNEGATLIADGQRLNINRHLDETITEKSRLYVICDQETYDKLIR